MCLNKKVLTGLAVAGLVIFAFVPNLIDAALPLLLVAACPLSMLVMMRGMSGSKTRSCSTEGSPEEVGSTGREVAELRAEVEHLRAQQHQRKLAARPDSGLS